jgi:hypothetical protein
VSEAAQIALIGAIATAGVALLGLAANIWLAVTERTSRRKERAQELEATRREREQEAEEWRRRTLFEWRLQAVTEAYGWTNQFNRLLNRVHTPEADSVRLELRQVCLDSGEWYDKNALYLFGGLPTQAELIGLINARAEVAAGGDGRGVRQHFNAADREIKVLAEEIFKVTTMVKE